MKKLEIIMTVSLISVMNLSVGHAFLAALLAEVRSYGAAAVLASASLGGIFMSSRWLYRLSGRPRGETRMDVIRDVLKS